MKTPLGGNWRGSYLTIDVQITRIPERGIEDLPLPSYGSELASGADLCAAQDAIIQPGHTFSMPTGLRVAIPEGWEIQIRSRSGLAAKKSLSVLNSPGTIDADYRGEIFVILHNHGTTWQHVRRGDRVAQMMLHLSHRIAWKEVPDLPPTARGAGGLGSTGLGKATERQKLDEIFGKDAVDACALPVDPSQTTVVRDAATGEVYPRPFDVDAHNALGGHEPSKS